MTDRPEQLVSSEPQSGLAYSAEQFAKGLFNTGIESPINAVLQIGSNVIGADYAPKLDIVDAPDSDSIAGIAGSVTGAAVNFYLLNKAASPVFDKVGLSGLSTGAQVARMALTGAIYEGIFLESDPNSKDFWTDRLKAAALGGSTFALMGATASGVDKLGIFAVPEARTLIGSIAHGALTGTIAGLGRAEISSLIKDQRLATGHELLRDSSQYALFGGVFGAASYAQNVHANAVRQRLDGRPNSFESDFSNKIIDIKRDAQGNVVQAVTERAVYNNGPYHRVTETLTQMTDGNWKTSVGFDLFGRRATYGGDAIAATQTADGTLAVLRAGEKGANYFSIYKPNQQGYFEQQLNTPGFDPKILKFKDTNIVLDNNGYRDYKDNKIQALFQKDANGRVRYQPDGTVQEVTLSDKAGHTKLRFSLDKKGGWNVTDGDYTFNWNGKISTATDASKKGIVEFTTGEGSVQKLSPDVQVSELMSRLRSSMTFKDGPTTLPVVNVEANGKIFLTEATGYHGAPIVNKTIMKGTQEIKPGDDIAYWTVRTSGNIYDRDTDTFGRLLRWGRTPDGLPTLDGNILSPGSRHQIARPNEATTHLPEESFYRTFIQKQKS